MGELPTVALSIMQPWAWLIVNGYKDVENRDWSTRFRGRILIHASKTWDEEAGDALLMGEHPAGDHDIDPAVTEAFVRDFPLIEAQRGGVVGVAEIWDCVARSESHWFVGRYGFLMRAASPLPLRRCRGMPGIFTPDFSPPPPKPPKVGTAVRDLFS